MTISPNAVPPSTSDAADFAGRFPEDWSLADLQELLGGVPAPRIRLTPAPGAAREVDAELANERSGRLVELEHGVLVEKSMGWYESLMATLVATELTTYLREHDRGLVFGADGPFRIAPGVIKIPDVSFVSWERWSRHSPVRGTAPALAPDLAVEVLSESNTDREMAAKIAAYFGAGVRQVWLIDPSTKSARVYLTADTWVAIERNGEIQGGELLPDFRLSLARLFARADRSGPGKSLDSPSREA